MADPAQLFALYRDRGDLRALARVFDRVAPQLLRVARSICPPGADAEDLVHDAFLKAIESAHTFCDGRRLEPWLAGILVNRVRNARRASRASQLVVEPAADSGPAEAVAGRELRDTVEDRLRSLPAVYREVLEPFLRGGTTGVDIARGLGRSPGVVRMQIRRGLIRLRRLLPVGFATSVAAVLAPRLSALARTRRAVLEQAAEREGVALANRAWFVGSVVMKKVVVLAVALAAISALWFVGLRPDATAEGRVVAGPDPAPTVERLNGAVGVAPSREPDRSKLPRRSTASSRDARVDVLVVRDGVPVPDAKVTLVTVVSLPDSDRIGLERDGIRIAELTREFGVHATTNEHGRATFTLWNEQLALITASKGSATGMRLADVEDARPLRLEIADDPPIRVRVVDERGQPAIGVPVALSTMTPRRRRLVLANTTAPDGIAELAGLLTARATAQVDDLLVELPLLLGERVERRILDAHTIHELRLPSTAEVELALTGPAGLPVRGAFSVRLRARPAGSERPSGETTVRLTGGRCVVPYVGLGLSLDVEVTSIAYASRRSEHAGPTTAGQRLRIDLPPRDLPVLAARVLADGRPLGSELVRLILEDRAGRDSQRRTIRTDPNGYLFFELPRFYERGERTLEVRRAADIDRRKFVDLWYRFHPGDNDLGDLALEAAPTIVTGTVVDPAGQPVSGALVQLHRLRTDRDEPFWDHRTDLDVVSDRLGGFEVRGWTPRGSEWALTASHPAYDGGPFVELPVDDLIYPLNRVTSERTVR